MATASQDLPNVKPEGFDDDGLDVVATQGAHLVAGSNTPICQKSYNEQFADGLERRLNMLAMKQSWRRARYHGDADEWRMGHTPPEVKEERMAEMQAFEDFGFDFSDNYGDDDRGPGLVSRVGTPVWQEPYDTQFVTLLQRRLNSHILEQLYGRAGHTPPEVKEEHVGDSHNTEDDRDKGGNDIDARVVPGNLVAATDWHFTPPPSAESSLVAL